MKVSIIEALLRKKKYFCLSPFERSFGNPAEEIFFGLMAAKMKGQKLVIISRKQTFLRKFVSKFIRDRMMNKEIFDLQSPGLIVPHRDVAGYGFFAAWLDTLYLFFSIIRSTVFKLTKFDLFNGRKFKFGPFFDMPQFGHKIVFNPDRKRTFSWELEKSYEWDKFLFEDYSVQLEEKKEKMAQESRVKMGLPLDAPYVCLHVRDIGFLGEKEELIGFRCSDIANYAKAVDRLIERGLWVVRIGDPRMKPAPFKGKKFIDYPFSGFRSDLMDLYLIRHCQFFLGTDSGPCQVSNLFQRKEIYVNLTGWVFPFKYGDLGITKYYYSKSRQRFLSVKEYLQEPYQINFDFLPQYPGHSSDYIIVENTPQDIEAIVEERLSQDSPYRYSDLQNEFISRRTAQCEEWIKTDPYFKNNPCACYRVAARVAHCKGTMGREFLSRNWEYGEYLEKLTHDFKKAQLDKSAKGGQRNGSYFPQKVSIMEVLLRKKKYFCLSPFERSFGNPAEDIFCGLMAAKMKGQKLAIISRKQTFLRKMVSQFVKDRMSNKEIFDLQSPGLIVPHRDVAGYGLFAASLDTLYLFFSIIRSLVFKLTKFDLFNDRKLKFGHIFDMPQFGQKIQFNPDDKKIFSWELEKSYAWDKFLFEDYSVQLEEKKEKMAQESRVKMGLPLDAPYVCLHVRDTGFKSETGDVAGFRCSDIANYAKAVDRLIERGLWVVRIGDPRMKPAPFKGKKFIDYPFSGFKSELLDLYLIKHCKLFIGTDSGPGDVAMMFQRNTIFVNLTGWTTSMPARYGDLAVTKYFYSKSRQRFLSIQEILQEPYYTHFDFLPQFPGDPDDNIIVENTPQDIEEIIEEKLGQNGQYTYSALQNEFISRRRAQCEAWIKTGPYFKNNPAACYRWALRSHYMGTLGKKFLRKNWEYGQHLEKMTHDFKKAGWGHG